jgi:hypothetical protein
MKALSRIFLMVAVALAVACIASAALPPGASDRVHARKVVNNVRVVRGTYYLTPWVYVWGVREAIFQLDCAGTAPLDSLLTVHLADDTSKAVIDSLAASTSANAAIDPVSNVALIGVKGNKALSRNAGKNYVLVPLTATTAGEAGGAGYIPVRWARLSLKFGSTSTTTYNGCDSLVVRTQTLRDWIFGPADY